MKNYKEIIEQNENEFNNSSQLIDFLDGYTYGENKPNELEDYLHEFADSLVPVYNGDIIDEWRNNGDCHEMTVEITGEYATGATIINMMQSDLFFWYEQELNEDYTKFVELWDEEQDKGEMNEEKATNEA